MSSEYKSYILLLVPISILLIQNCCAVENITQSQKLFEGQTLISPGQVFELGFFGFNNSVNRQYIGIWFKEKSTQRVVWVANRENPLRVTNSAASLRMSRNGNLELVDANDIPLWSTNVPIRSNNSVATLSDRGNLELKDADSGETLWESFTHPGDTFLPGSVIGFNMRTGENYTLTSWKSENDPSFGRFTAGVLPDLKPAQFLIWNGSSPHWRSGPWSRLRFTGLPDMASSYQSPFDLVEDEEKGTTLFSFSFNNDSVGTEMRLSPEGTLQLMFNDNGSDWYTDWESPKSPCDVYGFCGPSSVCKDSESPTCNCLKGFVPNSELEWSNRNWTLGCRRRKELDCQINNSSMNAEQGSNDLFLKFPNMKLPDLYEYVSLPSDGDACQSWCLGNCSCRACAYVNGIGCLTWSEGLVDMQEFSVGGGEDLLLRLVKEEIDSDGKDTKIIIISLATITSCTILCALLFIYLRRWRAKGKRYDEETTEKILFTKTSEKLRSTLAQNNPSELPIFDFNTIEVATGHFSLKNKLGQGGFGPVYKGLLQDGAEIAVKRLASNSGQGMEEFKNEMILISKLQHRNLVRLLGYCIDKEERLLIYEFMPNKSLDTFIFDAKRKAELNWITRFNILNGIARGLVYLHRDSFLRVIHRDLKVSNVLLDEKMNPKISDFGLARIFEGTVDLANTNRVVGTLGYMSPEYAMGGIFSEKSDVFSFGVLMLEIVSGRKNTSFRFYEQNLSLIAHAWHLWSEDRGLDMVDVVLEGSYSPTEVIRCIHIGLLCVQDHAGDRPSMPDIVSMLNNEKVCPEPKEPLFTFQRPSEFNQQNHTKSSGHEATMSILEGR